MFSFTLIFPSWGGMLNGLLTLRGAWDKVREDPVLKFFVAGVTFYGMATFEGPLLSIKSVSALGHYTDWIIGHAHGGALGWNKKRARRAPTPNPLKRGDPSLRCHPVGSHPGPDAIHWPKRPNRFACNVRCKTGDGHWRGRKDWVGCIVGRRPSAQGTLPWPHQVHSDISKFRSSLQACN